MSYTESLTLEEMILRLQEIRQLSEQKKVNLSQSINLLKEATELRNNIIHQLTKMENELITLNNSESVEENKQQENSLLSPQVKSVNSDIK